MPPAKRRTARKTAAKKTTARKPAKRRTVKKAAAKKTTARKPAKRRTVKKAAAKKTTKRAPAKRRTVKKAAAKKTTKRAPAKRRTVKKAAAKKAPAKRRTAKKALRRRRRPSVGPPRRLRRRRRPSGHPRSVGPSRRQPKKAPAKRRTVKKATEAGTGEAPRHQASLVGTTSVCCEGAPPGPLRRVPRSRSARVTQSSVMSLNSSPPASWICWRMRSSKAALCGRALRVIPLRCPWWRAIGSGGRGGLGSWRRCLLR